ncbi:hypothetical protein [Duganella qianjiadongensis]|uniref:Uncharacterized protein n=1 Tax=Duganella qianjiadongensis TaxID=2692176 RepID=A0ABW9VQ35_9BURK|nr:hypothetical protein [Duganella qianjiadongensis]MYM40523.1 hypothetical protein [Duganella qianjiadongensis]
MIRPAVFLMILLAAESVLAAPPLPKDVQAFVKNAEACEHMAGEWDSDLPKAQRRAITLAIKKYCAPAKFQLPLLMEKYKQNPPILRTISRHAYDSVKYFTEVDTTDD